MAVEDMAIVLILNRQEPFRATGSKCNFYFSEIKKANK